MLRWRRRLSRATLRRDLLAGITGAVVALPQGVAFAAAAGLPPQYGLYASMVPAIIAALFGSSWHLVSGPTTAASVVLFSVLSARADPGTVEYVQLALTLTLMVGVLQLALGALRLGAMVNFISDSVIVGFTAGAALLICASQLPPFLGLRLGGGGHFHQWLLNLGPQLADTNPYALLIGIATVTCGILARRRWPQVPYMLVAMLVGALLAAALELLPGDGIGLTYFATVPARLPPLSSPFASFDAMQSLAPAAFAMTLFALTEAVGIARSLALRSGQNLDANQEFVGQGLSNIAGSFFSGYVATGSFNRSAVNYEAGARTPLAAVISGMLLMAVVLVVAPLVAYLPAAAVAAILFMVAWALVDVQRITKIVRSSPGESLVMGTTFLATVLLDLEFAILLGVLLSLFLYLLDAARPRIFSRVPDPRLPKRGFTTDPALAECPQFKMVRVDGSLFYGAVHHVQKMLRIFEQRNPGQKHLLIIASGINTIDVSGAEFLASEARQRRAVGGALYMYRVKDRVVTLLRRGDYLDDIGPDNLFRSKEHAIATVFSKLDHEICRRCERRIFLECSTVERPQSAPAAAASGAGAQQAEPASS